MERASEVRCLGARVVRRREVRCGCGVFGAGEMVRHLKAVARDDPGRPSPARGLACADHASCCASLACPRMRPLVPPSYQHSLPPGRNY